MTLKDQMQWDVDNILLNTYEHAELGTYTPKDGEGIPMVKAIMFREQTLSDFEPEGEWKKLTATLRVSRTNVPNPERGDTWTDADSIVWFVDRILSFGQMPKLSLKYKKRLTVGSMNR